jgi:hypothetical protein
MKSQIIEQLGQTDILLPSLIGEGLAANDRVKVRLSVLQAAARHARDPQGPRFDLTEECQAAGIDVTPMEALVNGAGLIAGERIAAPGLDQLAAGIWDDVDAMIRAVNAGDAPAGEASAGEAARQRAAALKPNGSAQVPDTLELAEVARLAGVAGGKGDSLHRLVMDLHKALNRLAAEQAEGKPCVVGCAALVVDVVGRQARLAGTAFRHGDWLTIDGETGAIYLGRCRTRVERPDAELAEIERWRSKVA